MLLCRGPAQREGYLRIIDMGFAKQIPFFVTVDGEIVMHPRSHTMCGTPEYLAPEFIYSTGHDKSVDLWALGVSKKSNSRGQVRIVVGSRDKSKASPDLLNVLLGGGRWRSDI